jgi:NAD(P)H dehydrogenase (quinone)
VRMNLYLDFIPSMVGADGVIRGPAGDGRVSAVLRDDVADVAASILTTDGHDGGTYDVTGRESLSLGEAADQMSRLTGKPVRFHDETAEEAYASRQSFGAPDWEIEGWVGSYLEIASGNLDVISDTVRRLAGHEPVALAEYLRAHPESLDHVTVS